jgi:Rrf2 family protein
MLQITRQTEYAIRGLQELARNCDVSEAFLAKIFQMLSQQHIVKSHRGVKGGFSLGRNPEEITLRDIVEVCEGGIALNHCLRDSNRCENADECNMTEAWEKAQAALVGALDQTRLADLL